MNPSSDRNILRELARHVAEIAELPVQEERRKLWTKHNSLQTARSMILVFPEGSQRELINEKNLKCKGEEARWTELALRKRIYYHEHFQDDTVIEREWNVQKAVQNSGWGLERRRITSSTDRGAWKFDSVIKDITDLKRLHYPEIIYDKIATEQKLTQTQELFGDILDVNLMGVNRISYHLMNQYTSWRGLQNMMTDIFRQPRMFHDVMMFLEEGHRCVLKQYIDQNLLSLNNNGTYHSSGGNGYTNEFPRPNFDPDRVRPCDMWASSEAQEMAQVGPQQHAEFSLQYEKRLLEPFGLNGYGCCEDLTSKLDDVLTVPNLRRISISPFADVEKCAEKLQGRYVFSWKPNPTHLVGKFNERFIRKYIRCTIEVARDNDCMLEMILKDTYTCEYHSERFDRWIQIAREEIDLVGYQRAI